MALLTRHDNPGVLLKRSNEHAAFGTVIHAGAGAFWQARTAPASSEMVTLAEVQTRPALRAREAVERTWNEEFARDTKTYSLELALSMIDAYARKAELTPLVPGEWTVKGLEERMEVMIGPYRMTFMMDRWFAAGAGNDPRYLFVDTKTAGSFRAGWTKGYNISLQMKLYKYAIWKLTGVIPDGVIEGVLKKVPTEIEYHPLPDWGESMLEEAALQFVRIAEADQQLIEVASVHGAVDSDALLQLASTQTSFNDNDCYAYGSPCPFLDVCNAPPEERLALLKGDYQTYEPDWVA